MHQPIGENTEAFINQEISRLLKQSMRQVNLAYAANDEDLDISFKIKLKGIGPDAVNVKVAIGFVESRVKRESGTIVHEKQLTMFPGKQEAAQ